MGEKLAGEAKAPAFLGEKLAEMKKLWQNTNDEAKRRLDDLRGNAGCWNTFAEKCALLQTHVTTAQKQIDDVKTASEVTKALDEKLAWLDEFNKNIIDYNKICTDLEAMVVKDRADLDALIKPAAAMKSTDRLVSAMDLADDIRGQVEIASAKQQLWDQGLAPE